MIYVPWSKQDIYGLDRDGVAVLWTEIDERGIVDREIGFAPDGTIVHMVPMMKRFGYFDNQVVDVSDIKECITRTEFETKWRQAECLL